MGSQPQGFFDDHARVGGCDGRKYTSPDRFSAGDERCPRETAMGVDACHHIAGRHCIFIILGRLLKDIVTRPGDIATLARVGTPSELIVIFQPRLLHTKLLHAQVHCCLYLKMRSRNQSVPCKMQGLRNWLRHFIPSSTIECSLLCKLQITAALYRIFHR